LFCPRTAEEKPPGEVLAMTPCTAEVLGAVLDEVASTAVLFWLVV
jgi:hypothetical protein